MDAVDLGYFQFKHESTHSGHSLDL